MRKSCSSGSVGERGGNEPLYPEKKITITEDPFFIPNCRPYADSGHSIFNLSIKCPMLALGGEHGGHQPGSPDQHLCGSKW